MTKAIASSLPATALRLSKAGPLSGASPPLSVSGALIRPAPAAQGWPSTLTLRTLTPSMKRRSRNISRIGSRALRSR